MKYSHILRSVMLETAGQCTFHKWNITVRCT